MAAPRHEEGGAVRPLPFFVYWRSQRRQFFSFRARVMAGSAREARALFRLRHGCGPEGRVVGVKACLHAVGQVCAASGRWVG